MSDLRTEAAEALYKKIIEMTEQPTSIAGVEALARAYAATVEGAPKGPAGRGR